MRHVSGVGEFGGAQRGPASRRRREARSRLLALLAAVAVLILAAFLVLAGGSGGEPAAQKLAQDYANAWSRGDYAQLYADVEHGKGRGISLTRFTAAFQAALGTSTATGAIVGRARTPSGGLVTVPVSLRTRVFGTIQTAWELPIVDSGAGARVAWGPSLAFPGLHRGEMLVRRSFLPRRGRLLTRNGSSLDALGPSASYIAGSVGPPPPQRARQLHNAGFPPTAQVGLTGLQEVFDTALSGAPGGELLAGTRLLASAPSRPAQTVRTSLSPSLQQLAVTTLGGQEGGILVMRPDTGEILSLAGSPFSELQPPGSTFKMVTLTAVLLAGLAKPQTTFPLATSTTIDGFTLHNANDENCGGTLANAFAVSCNSVFAPLGAKAGGARLVDAAMRYGFNSPPAIPIAAESTIPPAAKIGSQLDVASSAIGQGQVQATVLQMATVGATIALGGRRPTPTLALNAPANLKTVLPAAVARTIRSLMLGVVRYGTGVSAQIPGVLVAGKTGTAELATTQPSCPPGQSNSCTTTPNDPKNTDAWFVAFAPALHPRVVVGVLLAHDGAGGDTAAPVAKTMLEAALKQTKPAPLARATTPLPRPTPPGR
ncbi:MAG: penicillin-binding transpeptidase domain-containing protein [Solirubrobacteraceae bacterium]